MVCCKNILTLYARNLPPLSEVRSDRVVRVWSSYFLRKKSPLACPTGHSNPIDVPFSSSCKQMETMSSEAKMFRYFSYFDILLQIPPKLCGKTYIYTWDRQLFSSSIAKVSWDLSSGHRFSIERSCKVKISFFLWNIPPTPSNEPWGANCDRSQSNLALTTGSNVVIRRFKHLGHGEPRLKLKLDLTWGTSWKLTSWISSNMSSLGHMMPPFTLLSSSWKGKWC